jgi:hypothetical protein
MDKITHGLKTNNAKLKGLVNSMRSSRNFCVDVILICVILAIGEPASTPAMSSCLSPSLLFHLERG